MGKIPLAQSEYDIPQSLRESFSSRPGTRQFSLPLTIVLMTSQKTVVFHLLSFFDSLTETFSHCPSHIPHSAFHLRYVLVNGLSRSLSVCRMNIKQWLVYVKLRGAAVMQHRHLYTSPSNLRASLHHSHTRKHLNNPLEYLANILTALPSLSDSKSVMYTISPSTLNCALPNQLTSPAP